MAALGSHVGFNVTSARRRTKQEEHTKHQFEKTAKPHVTTAASCEWRASRRESDVHIGNVPEDY